MTLLTAASRVQLTRTTPTDRQCCVFGRHVLVERYGAEVVDRVAVWRWHLNPAGGPVGPWEPVVAAVDAGLGDIVESPIGPTGGGETVARRWHYVQGWRTPPFRSGQSGHTFFFRTVGDGRLGFVLDSNEHDGIQIGPRLLPWADVVREFRYGVAVAALRPLPHPRS